MRPEKMAYQQNHLGSFVLWYHLTNGKGAEDVEREKFDGFLQFWRWLSVAVEVLVKVLLIDMRQSSFNWYTIVIARI